LYYKLHNVSIFKVIYACSKKKMYLICEDLIEKVELLRREVWLFLKAFFLKESYLISFT